MAARRAASSRTGTPSSAEGPDGRGDGLTGAQHGKARATADGACGDASMLEAGVASGAIKFTNRGDVRVVVTIYGKVAEMAVVVVSTPS